MSTPTPWSGPVPSFFTGQYLKRTPGLGNLYVGAYAAAGGGGTVFDFLVNPPTSGVAAEEASLDWAQDKGSVALTSPTHGKSYYTAKTVTDMITRNFDWLTNWYIEHSILRDTNGVPIA